MYSFLMEIIELSWVHLSWLLLIYYIFSWAISDGRVLKFTFSYIYVSSFLCIYCLLFSLDYNNIRRAFRVYDYWIKWCSASLTSRQQLSRYLLVSLKFPLWINKKLLIKKIIESSTSISIVHLRKHVPKVYEINIILLRTGKVLPFRPKGRL